ncbi:MAG: hypothetical protein AAGE96_17615 [Cyanobacteria bacterium P01_G01_bin.19]
MKIKLVPLLAGLVALTIVAAPLTAQACSGSNKDKNTEKTNTSVPIQSSFTVERTSVAS